MTRNQTELAKIMLVPIPMMSEAIYHILKSDPRYKLDAYNFVRDALSYAQDVMKLGVADSEEEALDGKPRERHLTGQQLCEASRRLALSEYGLMARVVLNSWGIRETADLGEVVYNLIDADLMKKSDSDRREDFMGVFDFDEGFDEAFSFTSPDEIEL